MCGDTCTARMLKVIKFNTNKQDSSTIVLWLHMHDHDAGVPTTIIVITVAIIIATKAGDMFGHKLAIVTD